MENSLRLVYITELFKSSYKTLLFYTPRRAPAIPEAFFQTLRKLGQQEVDAVAFHEEPYILVHGGIKLDAECHPPGSLESREALTKIGRPEEPRFKWICEADTWMYFANLVVELVRDSGGHQYLRAGPHDEAMVMVSSGEYYDEDFQ